ncbi:MAG: hypothetical protein WHV44_17295, partial [Anaerolineales bacterium]
PLVILLMPADMNPDESALYQSTVYDLAAPQGYRFQVRNTLTAADMQEPGLEIVIALPPDPGIAALAASAPQVRVLAVNIGGLSAGGNLSVVNSADRPDVTAFLSGYIAALLSEDWRTGIILPKDAPDSAVNEQAFSNGRVFYCGLCRSGFPPFYDYPITVEVPADAKPAELPAYGDVFRRYMVDVVYVHEAVQTDDLLRAMALSGVGMIGTRTPTDPTALENWIATIQPDYITAIQRAWADLSAGQTGISYPSPLTLTNINPALLTPGKQRLADQMLSDLLNGLVDTGAAPSQP